MDVESTAGVDQSCREGMHSVKEFSQHFSGCVVGGSGISSAEEEAGSAQSGGHPQGHAEGRGKC